MTIDELMNQEIMARYSDGTPMKSYYITLSELFMGNKPFIFTIGVPTQEHADILNGYAMVQGMDNVRVRVDTSTPHIYRQI